MDVSVSPNDEIWILRVRHHISNAVYYYSKCDNSEESNSTPLRGGSLKPGELELPVRGGGVCDQDLLDQRFSTAGPRPGTGTWHQIYRAARDSPGIDN